MAVVEKGPHSTFSLKEPPPEISGHGPAEWIEFNSKYKISRSLTNLSISLSCAL